MPDLNEHTKGKKYSIAEFYTGEEDETVLEVVPSKWLVIREDKLQVFWPDYDTNKYPRRFFKDVNNAVDPTNENWKTLDVKSVAGGSDNWNRASKKCDDLIEGRNVGETTSDELPARNRRIIRCPQRYKPSSSSASEQSSDERVAAGKKKNKKGPHYKEPADDGGDKSADDEPLTPLPIRHAVSKRLALNSYTFIAVLKNIVENKHLKQSITERQKQISHSDRQQTNSEKQTVVEPERLKPNKDKQQTLSKSDRQQKEKQKPQNKVSEKPGGRKPSTTERQKQTRRDVSPLPRPERMTSSLNNSEQHENYVLGRKPSRTDETMCCSSCKETNKICRKLLKEFVKVKSELKKVNKRLSSLTCDIIVTDEDHNIFNSYLPHKLTSVQELRSFEGLLQNSEVKNSMMKVLASLGGANADKLIRNIMSAVVTNNFARDMNWTGQNGNVALDKSVIKKFFIGAARLKIPSITDALFQRTAISWMKYAGKRKLEDSGDSKSKKLKGKAKKKDTPKHKKAKKSQESSMSSSSSVNSENIDSSSDDSENIDETTAESDSD